MQSGLQTYTIGRFQGVRNWENDNRIPSNMLYYAQNSEINGGRWRSGKGSSAYLPALGGGTSVRGLLYYPYQIASNVTHYLLEYHNGNWYAIDTTSDTRVSISDTWVVDEDAAGTIYNNHAYVLSPNNGLAWLDGLTWSTSFVGTPPPGSLIAINGEKMWIAGVPGAPSVIFYSRTATATNPQYIRDWTTGSGSALLGKGGYIAALANLKDVLYVLKNDSIYYLQGFDTGGTYPIPIFKEFSVTSGTINRTSIALVENDIWFLTPSLEIRSLGSAENFLSDPRTRDISLTIKRYLSVLDPQQPYAAMSYFNKVVKIALRTYGSEYNNWTLVYDYNDGTFSIERKDAVKEYANTNVQRFFSENSGQLYKDNTGYTRNGTPYVWSGKTLMIDLGRPGLQKRMRYLTFAVKRSEGHEVRINLYKDDYGNTPTTYTLPAPTASEVGASLATSGGVWGDGAIGDAVWGGIGYPVNPNSEPTTYRRVFKIDIDQTGRQFGVECSATINGGIVEIEQIDFQYIILPEKNKYVDL